MRSIFLWASHMLRSRSLGAPSYDYCCAPMAAVWPVALRAACSTRHAPRGMAVCPGPQQLTFTACVILLLCNDTCVACVCCLCFVTCTQLFRGLYAPYLRIWLQFLPRSHVLVVKAADYFANPLAVTNQVS